MKNDWPKDFEEGSGPDAITYGCVAGALLLGIGFVIIKVIIYYLNQL